LQPTLDNGYIYTNWQAVSVYTTPSGNNYYYWGKYFLTKIDNNRNIIYKNVFGIQNGYDYSVLLYCLKKSVDNKYVAVGHRYNRDVVGSDTLIHDVGYVVKFDENGTLLWERFYALITNVVDFSFVTNKLYDFDFKNDGGIIACGDVLDLTAPNQQQKAWLLSLDSYGCLSAGCQLFDAVTETEKKEGVFKAYPNPANDVLYIQHLPGFEMQHCELQMTEITGKIVMQQKLINQEVTYIYSTETLNNGIYFLSLKTESGLVQTEKIMVNR